MFPHLLIIATGLFTTVLFFFDKAKSTLSSTWRETENRKSEGRREKKSDARLLVGLASPPQTGNIRYGAENIALEIVILRDPLHQSRSLLQIKLLNTIQTIQEENER